MLVGLKVRERAFEVSFFVHWSVFDTYLMNSVGTGCLFCFMVMRVKTSPELLKEARVLEQLQQWVLGPVLEMQLTRPLFHGHHLVRSPLWRKFRSDKQRHSGMSPDYMQ